MKLLRFVAAAAFVAASFTTGEAHATTIDGGLFLGGTQEAPTHMTPQPSLSPAPSVLKMALTWILRHLHRQDFR
jgi:hypothetical protein